MSRLYPLLVVVLAGVLVACTSAPLSRTEAAMRRAEREQAAPAPVYSTPGAFEARLAGGSLHKASGLVCPPTIANVPLAATGTRRSPDGGEVARCQYTARAFAASYEIEIESTPMQRLPVDLADLTPRVAGAVEGRAQRDAAISGPIGADGRIWPSGVESGQARGLWAFRWNTWRVGVIASFPESQVDIARSDIARLLDVVHRTSERR